MGAASGIEGVGADIDLEEVLYHEVAAEVVTLAVGGAVDGADDHKDREHYRRLHGGCRNEGREYQVDQQKAPEHALGVLAELDDEGQGESLGELRLDQHRGQHEAQDIQPHHRVTQLCQRLFLRGDVEEHHEEDQDEGGQIVRYRLGHPEDETGHENGQHRVVGTDKAVEPQGVEPFLRRCRKGAGIQVVEESDVAEPAYPYECNGRQRSAETRHPDLESGFLHLWQLLDLVIVHIQRIKLLNRL